MRCGRTVLVVEDDEDSREAMATLLTAKGYGICTAGDGASALEVLHRHPECDLIVLDWRLPDMDGSEVLRALGRSASRDVASGRTILLVEDHEDTREATAALLTAEGYVVQTAGDCATALDTLQLHPEFGLVLLDWRLPDMDGGDVLRALRAEPEPADLPVVVLSADGLVAEEVHATGATAFLHKPLDPEVLMAVIAQYLQAREQPASP